MRVHPSKNLSFLVFVLCLSFSLCAGRPAHAQAIKDLFEGAAKAFHEGNYEKAIADYERIIEMEPNFAPAYNALGLAMKVRGEANDDVIFYFKKAIELDPNFLPSYDNLGKLYYSNGNIDAAEENFKKGLALDPENESLILSLGWIDLLGRNDAESANKHFTKIINKSGSAMAYFGHGICLMSDNKRMEVMEIVTKLRGMSQEGLARDLETMLRENRSLLRTELPNASSIRTVKNENAAKPAAPSKPASGQEKPKSPESLSEYDEDGQLRVRLLDKLPE
jgi:tetratricopeptide (TPR) repeat protein